MDNKREHAQDIAEHGLDKFTGTDKEGSEELIDRATEIDPKDVAELAEEVKRDKETAERFIGGK